MTFMLQPSYKKLCITPWIMHLHICTNVYYIRNNCGEPVRTPHLLGQQAHMAIMCIIITASVAWKPNPDEASKLRSACLWHKNSEKSKAPTTSHLLKENRGQS